jgi:hypothetical protein
MQLEPDLLVRLCLVRCFAIGEQADAATTSVDELPLRREIDVLAGADAAGRAGRENRIGRGAGDDAGRARQLQMRFAVRGALPCPPSSVAL